MIRIWKAIRFFFVMVGYSVHMFVAGRRLKARARTSFIARRQRKGCISLVRGLRMTTEVRGTIPEGMPSLIVSNHIGTLDPWILASNFDVAFVAKSEMGTWPVIGFVCKAVGIIFAHRRNVMKTADTVTEIQERMRSGVSVLIFPEGTTSNGRQLLPFKTGGFEAVAGMEDGYVIPMYFHVRRINGEPTTESARETVTWSSPQTMFANLRHMLGFKTLHYVIRVGSPISASGRDRKQLAREAQAEVQRLMDLEIAELHAETKPHPQGT
jgi:1-acyl-sn-glycerol-3-phosphate acyltransferase